MKTSTLFLSLFLFFSIQLAYSQNENNGKQPSLTGNWIFDDTNSFSKMHPVSKRHLDTIPNLKSQIMAAYSGRQLYITPDGTFTVSLTDGQSATCNWSLSNDGTLALIGPGESVTYMKVKVLTKNKLVVVPRVSRDMRNIIEEQHYIRQ